MPSKSKGMPLTHTAMVDNLSAVLETGTADQLSAGLVWYASASSVCQRMALEHDVTFNTACGVVAALSPRVFWSTNIAAADHMLATNGEHYDGILWTSHNRALEVMRGADPLSTWSERTAPKIRAFYRNLSGDLSAVTVDVWASLAALGRDNDPANAIRRVGGYAAVSEAYRALAGTVGLEPAVAQAEVWCVIRGGAE